MTDGERSIQTRSTACDVLGHTEQGRPLRAGKLSRHRGNVNQTLKLVRIWRSREEGRLVLRGEKPARVQGERRAQTGWIIEEGSWEVRLRGRLKPDYGKCWKAGEGIPFPL